MSDSLVAPAPPPAPGPRVLQDYLGFLATSGTLCYCRDPADRILIANPAVARKLGLAPEALVNRATADFIHPDDRAFTPPCTRSGLEQRWFTPQGWRWITWDETVLQDEAGHIVGTRAVGQDTTRQRLAEEQFYKLSRAFDQAPVAMVITDHHGRVQYVNARFSATTGRTLEQILDEELDVLREGHPDEASYLEFWSTVHAGREWRGELQRTGPDGKPVWEYVQVSCLRNPTGEITNLLCLREDITARKQLEDQLRQAQKMESIGTLAGGIAHDFNNLLAIISGYAELTLLKDYDTETVRKSTHAIKRATQRAIVLVRQILAFSRKNEVRFNAIELNQVLRDLTTLLGETFPRNVSVQLDLLPDLPPLLADQNQLHQVILNLCVNARDAMPDGGTITLRTSHGTQGRVPAGAAAGRRYACLEIGDTGCGMKPETVARIFEPFYTTKPVNQGTGLGLAVVYGIVSSHHGYIEVDSQPGTGSTFRLFLPLAEDIAPSAASTAATDFPPGDESILVVDDEAPLRNLLEIALTGKGYQVAVACDGLEAIALLSESRRVFHAILLDLNMPGVTGLEVLKVIHAVRPEVRVLIMTGHLSPEARVELEQHGQSEILCKPYSLNELGRKLRTILDTP